jgi:hypothetical protein
VTIPPPPPPSAPPPNVPTVSDNHSWFRQYVEELRTGGSISDVDASAAEWVVDRLEEPIDDIDTTLNLHPELQIRINGLSGKYEGLTELAKKERDTQHARVQKEHANDPNIKGAGKVSILKNIADADPLYVQHNMRYARLGAAHKFFLQIGILVQLNKNLREDQE